MKRERIYQRHACRHVVSSRTSPEAARHEPRKGPEGLQARDLAAIRAGTHVAIKHEGGNADVYPHESRLRAAMLAVASRDTLVVGVPLANDLPLKRVAVQRGLSVRVLAYERIDRA